MDLIKLIQEHGALVILSLLIGIPAIVNFIKWCKDLWKKRESFKQENIQKGREIEQKAEKEEHRF